MFAERVSGRAKEDQGGAVAPSVSGQKGESSAARCTPLHLSYPSAPTPPPASLTLGNLDVQGCTDQSHEGRIEVDGVVIGDRQIHSQEALQKSKGEDSHSQAPSSVSREPDPPSREPQGEL